MFQGPTLERERRRLRSGDAEPNLARRKFNHRRPWDPHGIVRGAAPQPPSDAHPAITPDVAESRTECQRTTQQGGQPRRVTLVEKGELDVVDSAERHALDVDD